MVIFTGVRNVLFNVCASSFWFNIVGREFLIWLLEFLALVVLSVMMTSAKWNVNNAVAVSKSTEMNYCNKVWVQVTQSPIQLSIRTWQRNISGTYSTAINTLAKPSLLRCLRNPFWNVSVFRPFYYLSCRALSVGTSHVPPERYDRDRCSISIPFFDHCLKVTCKWVSLLGPLWSEMHVSRAFFYVSHWVPNRQIVQIKNKISSFPKSLW
jgi:hypothetical protein